VEELTVSILQKEARLFSEKESSHKEAALFGLNDGKAIGTYLEHKFKETLSEKYLFPKGSSAKGIDFPELNIDIKTTSIKQPQSSCPYKSAGQKIFGLGYSLLVFVYEKIDFHSEKTSTLKIHHTIYIDESRTADFQLTSQINIILDNAGNHDDILALLYDKNLPIEEISAEELANEIQSNKPKIGYLTISNALQWRLQYQRVIDNAGKVEGIIKI
jgi:hypothetical protein